ncbi:MAG TPA: tetratricopeptide repeat protein [Bryobacteraceae bacterium]|nr:tetratricopeptide repeat protein [Bryobacteraceae bacterium]
MGISVRKRARRLKSGRPAPSTRNSLHISGLAAAAEGKHELAASLFGQAIQLEGPKAQYCESLARALQACGRFAQAAICYQQAIAGAPDNTQLYLELARTLLQDNRGTDAIAVLGHALAAEPNAAWAWALLGGALSLTGHSAHAPEALRRAIELEPGQAGFHYDLGLVLSQLGKQDEAEASYRRALEANPQFPEALNNLGNLLRRRNAGAEAVVCFLRALRCQPEYPDARYNLGLALQDLDLPEVASSHYEAVLRTTPNHHAAHNNYANALIGQNKVNEALAHYERALQLAPGTRDYMINQGMAQLLNGNFTAGWKNYGARISPALSGTPLWSGEPIYGRSILLLAEQGLGDTLQFIRYARQLRYDGGCVRALCQPPLAELLRSVPGIESVTPMGETPPACDWYAPMLHLPGVYGTRAETIPAEIPYLFADPQRVRDWGLRLGIPDKHLKVGITWRGGAEHKNDRNRSMDPEYLKELDGVPDTTFVSLQKGYREGSGPLPFAPLSHELTDFADTAALISNLDLVISVDTSVAHLAGAMARPVWTLLPFAADWRWLRERTDSPWYPGMRLFRQERRGEWRPVLRRVHEALLQLRNLKQQDQPHVQCEEELPSFRPS